MTTHTPYTSCARALLYRDEAQAPLGEVHFQQAAYDLTRVTVRAREVPPGAHGLHVHQSGDRSRGCASMGAHYSRSALDTHGGRCDAPRHTGDLGNVTADARGNVHEQFYASLRVQEILGRGVVLHEGRDDCGRGGNQESLRTGNAGARYACGVVAADCV